MSVSKYASLPDVDTSGLEAFETEPEPVLSKARAHHEDSDDEAEGARDARHSPSGADELDFGKLDVTSAHQRFERSAGIDGAQADFSQSIAPRKARRRPARPRSPETYESRGFSTSLEPLASASTAPEPRAARLLRLQAEAAALAAELAEEEAHQGTSYEDGPADASSPAEMMRQLQALRQTLGGVTSQADQLEWRQKTRGLISGLAEQKARAPAAKAEGDAVPHHSSSAPAEGTLERRIAEMEEAIGVKAMLDSTALPARPVIPTLARLESLFTLLAQPRHLDILHKRVSVLLPVLEQATAARKALDGGVGPLAKSSAGGEAASSNAALPEEQSKKLAAVFPVLERVEPMLPLVPVLLARLQSLSTLHTSASTVVADLEALRSAQAQASAQETEMQQLLQGVRESMQANQQTVTANLEALEQRLERLDERVAKLGQ